MAKVRNEHRRAYLRGEIDGLTEEQIAKLKADLAERHEAEKERREQEAKRGSVSNIMRDWGKYG